MAFAIKLITSPIKITCQLATGNLEGARETTKDVIVSTPVVSHVAAGVVKLSGDDEAAAQLWNDSNRNLNSITNSIPVVGHAKGLVHYACQDTDGGQQAIQTANRSTAAVAEGVGQILVAVPKAGVQVVAGSANIVTNIVPNDNQQSTVAGGVGQILTAIPMAGVQVVSGAANIVTNVATIEDDNKNSTSWDSWANEG